MHDCNMKQAAGRRRALIPLWIKLPYTLFVCVLVPVYWHYNGPANFLWFSDFALLLTTVALWRENRLLAGMMSLATLLPEIGWNIDFFSRLLFGFGPAGADGTHYMFDPSIPLPVRTLSLFHVFLPWLLLGLVIRLGYEPRSLRWQTLLAWIVLPASYLATDTAHNINFVLGFGMPPQTGMPPLLYLALLMLLLPLCIYLPTHLLLIGINSRRHRKQKERNGAEGKPGSGSPTPGSDP